jgi:hypothetical protein
MFEHFIHIFWLSFVFDQWRLFVLQNRRIREHLRQFATLRQHSLQRAAVRQWMTFRLLHARYQTRAKIVHRLFTRLVRRLLSGMCQILF